jgi:hypothetical protein
VITSAFFSFIPWILLPRTYFITNMAVASLQKIVTKYRLGLLSSHHSEIL